MTEATRRRIDLEGTPVEFELRRSVRARHLRAAIGLRTGLRVTLPRSMDEARVEAFLRSRRRWIVGTLRRFERLAARIPDRPLSHGSTVPYLGRDLALDLSVGPARAGRRGDSLIVHVPRRTKAQVRRALEAWYRQEAERELGARAGAMARRHGIRYRRIRISDARSRWGSCSSRGSLSFNWRLLLAPEAVAEYLIAHELAHLEELNHSDRFWRRVESLCPSYRDQERWLRRFGVSLVL